MQTKLKLTEFMYDIKIFCYGQIYLFEISHATTQG